MGNTESDFSHIVGTRNLQIAYELSFQLKMCRPKFSLGNFVFKLVQLLVWVGEGKAQVIREDYLQNVIGLFLFEKTFSIDMDDDDTEYNIFYYWQSLRMIPQDADRDSVNNFIDPVSRFHNSFGTIRNNSCDNTVPTAIKDITEPDVSDTIPITINNQDINSNETQLNTNEGVENDELDFPDDELDITEEIKGNAIVEEKYQMN